MTTLRGAILEDTTPTTTKHGTVRGIPLKDVLEHVVPELNTHCLRLALSVPQVSEQLRKLDEQGVSTPQATWRGRRAFLLAHPSYLWPRKALFSPKPSSRESLLGLAPSQL